MIGSRWTGLLAALTLVLASALTLANAGHPQTASSQGLEIRKVEASGCDQREVQRVLDRNSRRLFFASDDADVSS